MFAATLKHQAGDVQVAALKAATTFIRDLENSADRNKLQDLVPDMLQTIAGALNAKDESAAQEALEMFISIAETYPRFLRRQLEQVLQLMLQVRLCRNNARLPDAVSPQHCAGQAVLLHARHSDSCDATSLAFAQLMFGSNGLGASLGAAGALRGAASSVAACSWVCGAA